MRIIKTKEYVSKLKQTKVLHESLTNTNQLLSNLYKMILHYIPKLLSGHSIDLNPYSGYGN